jgi:hypothetical protein
LHHFPTGLFFVLTTPLSLSSDYIALYIASVKGFARLRYSINLIFQLFECTLFTVKPFIEIYKKLIELVLIVITPNFMRLCHAVTLPKPRLFQQWLWRSCFGWIGRQISGHLNYGSVSPIEVIQIIKTQDLTIL